LSLYADYVREINCGRNIVEVDKVWFLTYYVHKDIRECYIEDMYIHPRYRNGGLCFKILNGIQDTAKKMGCTQLTHAIVKKHKNFEGIKLISEKFGFVQCHETDKEVYFAKEIA
jgi:GNAT superfamily N-acetyltransferase